MLTALPIVMIREPRKNQIHPCTFQTAIDAARRTMATTRTMIGGPEEDSAFPYDSTPYDHSGFTFRPMTSVRSSTVISPMVIRKAQERNAVVRAALIPPCSRDFQANRTRSGVKKACM
ncbi:hypothetical protein NDQ57_16560 [Rossellomorea marisflavi]|uniref:hypothetical protein n=1 Tax=Rossellomorea marisflavi TaxID=189381 RepID=UPI00203B176F|nr:hypothetical protein [Rossellomorea marisflavi]MCM2606283.1 hypothetical protein [Rossellomorea marisflavi]